jgi:omega-6 fatty acid desaturase (delta-12 desaturase)
MNKERYLAIRNSFNLEANPNFLTIFATQTAFLVCACVWLVRKFPDSSVRFLAIPLISVLMFRSFAFMHEAVHGLLSKKTRINDLLGIFSGACCLLSYESWKQAHLEHHRWSGNLDKDPVMAMIKIFPTFPKKLRSVLTFGWKCWLPTLSFLQHTVFWSITVRHTLKKPQSTEHLLSVIFPILFWTALISLMPWNVALTILAPGIGFYLIGTEVINAPHHLGLTYFRGETKLALWEQFKIARSCVYPSWLARFVVLNFNFHSEHHMYPYVAWYHLDKLHEAVRGELKEQYNIDPQFSWVIKNRSQDLRTVFGCDQVTTPVRDEAAA